MKTRHVSRWITVGAACLAIPFFFANLSSAAPPDYLIADRIAECPPEAWRYTKSGAVTLERLTFVEPYGDYNDDGFADVLVGTKAHDFDGIEGYVRLLSGKDGTVLFSFNASETDGDHAYAWPVAGNINGDGLPDIVLGVTYYDVEGPPVDKRAGSALVFLTSNGQFGSGPSTTLDFDDADLEIEGQNHPHPGSPDEQGQLGYNLALVDLDGNGLKDLVLGEWQHDVGTDWSDQGAGAFYVYSSCELTSGAKKFFADDDHRIAIGDNCHIELSLCMDALGDGQVVMGAASWWKPVGMDDDKEIFGRVYVYDYSGVDCVNIHGGRFNKINFNVVVVDNPETLPLETFEFCTVFPTPPYDQDFGHRTAPAGDFDNDGDIDLLVGAKNRNKAWLMRNDSGAYSQHGADYGTSSPIAFGGVVGTIGDIDGDGYDDFAISDTHYKVGGVRVGRVFVYSGRTATVFPVTEQVPPIFTITGENQHINIFGGGLGPVGDINHDGVPDLGISARGYNIPDPPNPDIIAAGAVYGFFTPTEPEDDVTVDMGTFVSGTIIQLGASDDTYYVVDSEPVFPYHKTVIDVVFDVPTPNDVIAFVGVTVESKFAPTGFALTPTGEVFIKNGLGQFEAIDPTWNLSTNDTLEKFFEIPDNDYVDGNGQITVRIEHRSMGSSFTSSYDKVTLVVSRTAPIPIGFP